ncbi:hypothetical protein SO802_017798 [Lithocarpus litseifolius]|uniref:Protein DETOXIFICATION n=1 Tax=Lithocarpus litseifolius TaxID=425828 RepID=A0AAW2CIZ8_9ROSI
MDTKLARRHLTKDMQDLLLIIRESVNDTVGILAGGGYSNKDVVVAVISEELEKSDAQSEELRKKLRGKARGEAAMKSTRQAPKNPQKNNNKKVNNAESVAEAVSSSMAAMEIEIAQIAVPAALALAADPIASLIDTAFIGQIGPVELAAVGVSIALFNQVSRIAIFPLVSVTTSFVAEENAIGSVSHEAQDYEHLETGSTMNGEDKELIPKNGTCENAYKSQPNGGSFEVVKIDNERRHIPSASSALVIGSILGLIQAIFLIFGAKPLLGFMGVSSDSPMLTPAQQYLTLRSLGAPVVLLSLAMQGVFRGFKDTKTPLYATVAGDVTNIILDPLFMFVFHMGISGAAIAHVISQYLISVILLWKLMEKVDLLPPSSKHLQFGRFLKNGKQLKEYEEKTNELLAKVNDLEKKVDELQDELRIKQEKVVKGKELTKNLVEKIERLTSEISDDQQLLRENKKEKKLPEMHDRTSGASLLLPLTSKDKDHQNRVIKMCVEVASNMSKAISVKYLFSSVFKSGPLCNGAFDSFMSIRNNANALLRYHMLYRSPETL